MFVDGRLLKAASILRAGYAVPTILHVDAPGPTRAREVEAHGATTTYIGRFLPQVHADVPVEAVAGLVKSRLAQAAWFDEPQYAVAVNPFRSSNEEIQGRIVGRLARTGAPSPPPGGSHLRTYLGMAGPAPIPHDSAYMGLDDVRRFTRSDELAKAGAEGKGVTIAVLDTGINGAHPMLDGQVREHRSFTTEPAGGDGGGHGTWIGSAAAGLPVEYNGRSEALRGRVLQGMASAAKLLDFKVLTSEGTGLTSQIIQGIEAAVEAEADIINMSLGSLFGLGGQGPDAQAVNEAAKRGVHCVCAAGNSFLFGTIGSPASAAGSIAVGSVAMKVPRPGVVSTFSSKGPVAASGRLKPEICAPGGQMLGRSGRPLYEAILGAASGVLATESLEAWAYELGTSMATPCVSGILAQLVPLGLPKDRGEVEFVLSRGTRERTPLPVKSNRLGWGVVDAVALARAVAEPPSVPIRGLVEFQAGRERRVLGRGLALVGKAQRVPGPGVETLRLPST